MYTELTCTLVLTIYLLQMFCTVITMQNICCYTLILPKSHSINPLSHHIQQLLACQFVAHIGAIKNILHQSTLAFM